MSFRGWQRENLVSSRLLRLFGIHSRAKTRAFEDVARRYGIDSRIQYGKEITRCEFEDGRWKIELADGSTDVGDFVIAATGVLHHPAYPDIDGLDSFAGTMFHTARWDHEARLAGKRVGVVGTGSTASQIVGAQPYDKLKAAVEEHL